MNAICKCNRCGAHWLCRAEDDPETNGFELTGDQQSCPECGSDDFDVVDTEYPEPLEGDVPISFRDPDKKLGTPINQISGRPGHPGYEEFCRIARSWGHP